MDHPLDNRENEYCDVANKLKSVKKEILDRLNERGSGGFWIWHIFILCFIPGILNGLHISSYIFIGQLPNDYYCLVPELMQPSWTNEEIRNISTIFNGKIVVPDGCHILNWNYEKLSHLDFNNALDLLKNHTQPEVVSCMSHGGEFFFDQPEGISIVPEWNLICENSYLRTEAQGALAFGKLLGAFLSGILADKIGRRLSFIMSAILYIVAGPVAAVVPWYSVFILARIGIGIAGSGTYHTAYTILNETASKNHRSWMSIFYSAGYPVGMLLLAVFAYLIPNWRHLQLVLSIPAFILIYHLFFLVESPRWLLNQNRINEANKIVSPARANYDESTLIGLRTSPESIETPKKSFQQWVYDGIKIFLKEIRYLYGSSVLLKRALICHFLWFSASLSYYAIALNAENFSANRYIYVAVTGLVEIPSYIIPIIFLKFIGRKLTTQILFGIAGISLLLLLPISSDAQIWIIVIAMIGRLCISSVYAVVILYTSDLFPTEIRGSAIGTCSTCAHIGSIFAPYIVDFLGIVAWFIPTTICAGVAIISVILTIALPETKEKPVADKLEDEESDRAL